MNAMIRKFLAPFFDPQAEGIAAPALAASEAAPVTEHPTIILAGDIKLAHLESQEEAHYIHIEPSEFPVLSLGPKPHYSVYKGLREQHLNTACQAVEKYLTYAFSIDALENDVYSQKIIRKTLRYFLIRYWDMPSSAKHHHAYPWGHLCHCLEVAIGMAKQGSRWTPFTRHGIDEVKRSRYRGLVTVFYFLQGLMHDSYKLFQYVITAHLSPSHAEEFSPLERGGNVLDFKLKHGGNCIEGWKALNGDYSRYNVLEFLTLFPHSAMRDMPADVFYHAIFSFFDYKNDDIDIMSAVKDVQRTGGTVENLRGMMHEYFSTKKTGRSQTQNTVFYVNDKYIVVDAKLFFNDMPVTVLHPETQSFIKYLEFSNLIKMVHGTVFKIKTTPWFKGDDGGYKKLEAKELAFLSREIIRHVPSDLLTGIKTLVFTSAAQSELAPIAEEIASSIIDHQLLAGEESEGKEGKKPKGKTSTKKEEQEATANPAPDASPAAANPAPAKDDFPPAPSPEQLLAEKMQALCAGTNMVTRGNDPIAAPSLSAPPVPSAEAKPAEPPVSPEWDKIFASILSTVKTQDYLGKDAWIFMQDSDLYLEKKGLFTALGKQNGESIASAAQGKIIAQLCESNILDAKFVRLVHSVEYSSKTRQNVATQHTGCFFKVISAELRATIKLN